MTTDGIDFRLLTPTWLAIALFVAIPTTYGVVMSVWVERWLASARTPTRPWVAFLPLAAFLAGGPFGVALVVLLIVGWAVAHAIPALATVWSSPPVAWIGRILLAVVTAGRADDLEAARVQLADGLGEDVGDLVLASDRPVRELATEVLAWFDAQSPD